MRLSTVFELLLILLLVAFAAYGRVIEPDQVDQRSIKAVNASRQSNIGLSTMSLKQATDSVNRYCTCNENICNCCRDFHIPLVQLKGPGCASLQYLQGDNLAVQLSFGENILTSTIVNGKSPRPVCVPLPGGFTKFCGRIYSIQRDADNHFKACLGLELQSSTELEASLRVSCFRFGPEGLKLRPAEPLPIVEAEASEEEEDDDDFFGLGSDDDDDDDDEEEEEDAPEPNAVPTSPVSEDVEEDEEEDDDEDVLGLGALLDIITGEDDTTTKRPKVTTAAPLLQFTIPLLTRPTTVSPLESYDVSTSGDNLSLESVSGEELNSNPDKFSEEDTDSNEDEEYNVTDTTEGEEEGEATEASNKIAYYAKPDKVPANKLKATETKKKKPSITSGSVNAIENEIKKKKPVKKPIHDEDEDDDILSEEDLDDEDEDEEEDILDDEDEDDEDEKVDDDDDDDEHESFEDDEDEKAEDIDDLDDDEEEDAMISALVYDEKDEGKKDKGTKDQPESGEEDESDYGLGLSGLLARNRHARTGRQSRIMRL